jgi:FlaA1/EpsC-like NDP-sugar epimerase
MIVREMLKHPDVEYDPVGFVDDDPTKKGRRIHGVEVLGTHNDITDLAGRYEIEEVVIAIPSAPSHVIRDAVALCDRAGVKCKTLPGVFEMIDGRVELSLIRDVKVEDLLGREPVKIDLAEAAMCINDANILVTGAAGSIGSELCRQISRFDPRELILLDHNENDIYFLMDELRNKHPELNFKVIIGDIKDEELIDYIFAQRRPQVVFHAAAHKHVPLMQENPAAAVSNNVSGTRVVVDAADKYKVERFVLISTDKAVDPTGIMGTTKRISEMVMQVKDKISDTKYMAVRFGNVIGSNGSVVPVFKKQIELGGPVTVTHPEATRYFMSVSEATQLVMQSGAIGKGGEIFVLDMGEPVKIIDLARNLIKLSGFEPDVDIPIKITGLRPGEVLTEDLIGQYEELIKTVQDKVMVIKDSGFEHARFIEDVTELEMLVKSHDYEKIHSKMKSMVPSYEVKTSAKA